MQKKKCYKLSAEWNKVFSGQWKMERDVDSISAPQKGSVTSDYLWKKSDVTGETRAELTSFVSFL